jgi:hypothetical protein
MRKSVAILLGGAALSLVLTRPALAGSSADAALALGAFAVFNQIVTGQTIFQQGLPPRHVVRQTVIVQQPPPVVYAPPPPVIYAPPPPPPVVYAPPPVVIYPNAYSYAVPRPYYKHHRRHHRHDDDDDD